ncbi:unnamed protein product, partial [Cyprideis torosa]
MSTEMSRKPRRSMASGEDTASTQELLCHGDLSTFPASYSGDCALQDVPLKSSSRGKFTNPYHLPSKEPSVPRLAAENTLTEGPNKPPAVVQVSLSWKRAAQDRIKQAISLTKKYVRNPAMLKEKATQAMHMGKEWYQYTPAAMLDVRYYYFIVTAFNLLLLYTLWSWNLLLVALSWAAFRVGFPAVLQLKKTMPNFRSLGEWAVITGATDGIGKSYAKQMAKCGMGVVLVSRNQERLDSVAEEIQRLAGSSTKVRIIAIDFTHDIELETVKSQLDDLEIGVLINNVGLGYPNSDGTFLDVNGLEFHRKMVRCNVDSMLLMCSAVLPQMQERKKGLVINMGSMTSETQTAFASVYASTKAFVEAFSFCLAQEFAGTGVRITCTKPGFVQTKMIKNLGLSESFMTPSPDTYVESHLKTIATIPIASGYWFHDLAELVLIIETCLFCSDYMITGATDGIGKSYAKEMAKSGLGVVLISRNQERLDNVADEIRALAGPTAKIRTIAMDFTDDIALETVKSQLDGLEIGVLINNVGMSYPKRGGRFLKSGNDLDFHRKIIRCNVDSMVLMSTAVLPQMQDRRK